MKVYLLDEGILLTEKDEDFESYNIVYDKKYGYYDEGQCYVATLEDAINQAKQYVSEGVDNTYAVVSNTILNDDIDINDDDLCVENEEYLLEDVVYSVAKINGNIIENFISHNS